MIHPLRLINIYLALKRVIYITKFRKRNYRNSPENDPTFTVKINITLMNKSKWIYVTQLKQLTSGYNPAGPYDFLLYKSDFTLCVC